MRLIKDNILIRGIWSLYKDYFRISRRNMGHVGDNVIISHPFSGNLNNIFIGDK